MKKVLALAALAMLALAASQLVSVGSATRQSSIDRRVAALEKKVKVLQSSSTALKKRVTLLEGFGACLLGSAPVPEARYTGYLYTPDHGTTVGETTALDVTATGQTPQAYLVTINPSCLSTSAAASSAFMAHRHWAAPRALTARARP
jgi:hypothetical protein